MIVPINRVLNPVRLNDELLAAFPSLKTTGNAEFPVIHYNLTPNGVDKWLLEVPDNIDSVALAALIANHQDNIKTTLQQQEDDDKAALVALRTQYNAIKSGIAAVHADAVTINNGTNTPNSAQTGAALKMLATDMDKIAIAVGWIADALATIVRRAT